MATMTLQEKILFKLQDVKDPEIASISIVDLGMVHEVKVDGSRVTVSVLPTFVGCPALHIIERDIENTIISIDEVEDVKVDFVYTPQWTSDRISPEGRERLKEFGIAPPPLDHVMGEPWSIECPYCGSPYVTMENIFGPTACRCILYCKSCKNPFEAMKPVLNLD